MKNVPLSLKNKFFSVFGIDNLHLDTLIFWTSITTTTLQKTKKEEEKIFFKNNVGDCGGLWGKICNFEAEKKNSASCDY